MKVQCRLRVSPPIAALAPFYRASFLAELFDREFLVPHRFAVVLVDFETEEIGELADLCLAHKIEVVNALVLNHELDEQVRDAFGLPLRLLVPVTVGSVLLDHAIRKSRKVGHRDELRDHSTRRLRWIV
ncbi:hypothetical protein [Bradyrhizobium sp. MOS003]|uniref:hypothetical protein n=1 Tax=Bradyrhizobium sp. MOS003 TaxID=2133946 RepID=UPI000D12D785|nr:hypothetical protein [Bradyrhizobium sp. MOS003]PSO15040.1 hypothetical protein C7G42_29540 [Bradyrhizobium sp. MOS003]